MMVWKLFLLALVMTAAIGCETSQRETRATYQTVPVPSRGDTERARALNDLAIDQIDQGQVDDAEESLKRALTADVMFGPAHNNLGKLYYEQGKYYLAAWEFQYAIKCMPNHPEPRNNLGLVFERAERLDQAISYYREALELEPDNVEIIGNLARTQVGRGDRDEAVRALLAELIFKDTRPDWRAWAEEKLAMMGGPPNLD